MQYRKLGFITRSVVAAALTATFTFAATPAFADEQIAPTTPASQVLIDPATSIVLPQQPVETAPVLPSGCEEIFTPMDYRKFAKRVYKRETISKKARKKLAHITHCQDSKKDKREIKKHQKRYQQERKARMCSQTNVTACIRDAANKYNVSYDLLMRKARCESGLNPYATNGAHDGLFQFRTAAPSTWQTTPYGHKNYWLAKWNSMAAAWMHAQGRGGEWECR